MRQLSWRDLGIDDQWLVELLHSSTSQQRHLSHQSDSGYVDASAISIRVDEPSSDNIVKLPRLSHTEKTLSPAAGIPDSQTSQSAVGLVEHVGDCSIGQESSDVPALKSLAALTVESNRQHLQDSRYPSDAELTNAAVDSSLPGHVTADISTGHVTADVSTGHVTADIDAGHVTADIDAGHVTADIDAGHVTADTDAGHVTADTDAGHVTADIDAGHVTAAYEKPEDADTSSEIAELMESALHDLDSEPAAGHKEAEATRSESIAFLNIFASGWV